MEKVVYILIVLVVFAACNGGNKLNTNEQKLANEIKTEEQQKRDAEEELKQRVAAIPDTLSPGFRFKEDRSVDPDYPPKVIDIVKLFQNKKQFKLSELINEIEYITMEDIPETSYYKSFGYSTILADNYILIKSLYSLYLFNYDGSFKDIVCKSTGERIKNLEENAGKNVAVASSSGYVKGVWGNVWTIDDKLFYRYADNKAKKFILMSYDMDSPLNSIPLPSDSENFQVVGKGEVHASLGVKREERFTEIVPLNKDSYAGINRKTKSAKDGLLMTSFLLNGDTLSSFPDYETISNYSHSIMRGNFPQFIYQYGNTTTFLNAFNDTVYRILPPNRLVPAYILSMGDYKIKTQEGFTPDQDISTKLYVKDFFETKTHIYLKLISGYESPKTREKKSIKIYHAIYEKEKQQLNLLPINPMGYYSITNGHHNFYNQQGVVNDIDGGFLFWPQKVSTKGEIYEVVSGEKLKEHILSNRFINSTAPKNKKEELKKLSEKVRGDQLVLIVYK